MASSFEAASLWALIVTSALAGIALGSLLALHPRMRWVWVALLASPIPICSIVLPLVLVTLFPDKCDYIDLMGDKYLVDPCTISALLVHHLKYFPIMSLVLLITHFFEVHVPYWVLAVCVYFLTKKVLGRMNVNTARQ